MHRTTEDIRTVEWGHWSITFWTGDPRQNLAEAKAIATLPFACGPQGPIDGYIGSPLRTGYQDACRMWIKSGQLPEGSLVWLGQEWLFDHDNRTPGAIWRDGRWVSPVRVGRNWEFPAEVSQ